MRFLKVFLKKLRVLDRIREKLYFYFDFIDKKKVIFMLILVFIKGKIIF